jgi:NAD(P)-dependent dehydrogenase (short-subunit alcohol dehydrogenase family)
MGGRRTHICEEFAARLRSGGAAVFAAHLDLREPLSIDRFMQSADYLVGAVDALVSSAGIADRSWVGAQHLVTQLVTPMIDKSRGDVVLLSPELIGASPAGAHRMLDAWVSGLDAEFVGTGVRASVVRSTGQVPPDDVGRVIAAAICAPDRRHLRVVDLIPPVPASSMARRDRRQSTKLRKKLL